MKKLLIIFLGVLNAVKGQVPLDGSPFGPTYGTTTTPLTSEAYSEGSCISPNIATNADANWIVTQRTFYVPIASQFAHRRFAETLLSRSPTSEEELQSMCHTVEFNSANGGLNSTHRGFDDREFRQSCPVVGPGQFTCYAQGSSGGVNPLKMVRSEDYLVSVDNRSYMLLIRCVDGYFRDYQLLTTRPTVSRELYNTVLNITRNLGFDERRLQLLSYDNCLDDIEFNVVNPIRFQRRRTPFGYSPYDAPYAQNQLTSSINSGVYGLGQFPGPYGLGGLEQNLRGFGRRQNQAGFNLNQNQGGFGLNQNQGVFNLNQQNPENVGIGSISDNPGFGLTPAGLGLADGSVGPQETSANIGREARGIINPIPTNNSPVPGPNNNKTRGDTSDLKTSALVST